MTVTTDPAAPQAYSMPVVGIPTPVEQASWRVWQRDAHLLSTAYADRIRDAGAIPVMLPIGGDKQSAARIIERLDALILPGGGDVDPSLYDTKPHTDAGGFDITRDTWEIDLARAAWDRQLPILGICRGMQLLNVMLGGTLIQHVPDIVGTDVHNPSAGVFGSHEVSVASDSTLAAAIGLTVHVPTYHHQALDVVAAQFAPVAWAPDGIVEAVIGQTRPVLAVQWHPEVADADRVIRHFIDDYVGAASSRASAWRRDVAVQPDSREHAAPAGRI